MSTAPLFRTDLLSRLQAAHAARPGAKLHLLYAPGFSDPLGLGACERRTFTRIATPNVDRSRQAMVIELDCRKVAPYLLETDPGFDDPLFETSITYAHGYTQGQTTIELAEPQGRHLAGWLISHDSAATLAQRLQRAGDLLRTSTTLAYGTEWCDPRVISAVWGGLTPHQRLTLLGERTDWFAIDAAGRLVRFSAQPVAEPEDVATSDAQRLRLRHVPIVLHLLEHWRTQCTQDGTALPDNAQDHLHGLVRDARRHHLDGEDLQAYVFVALNLQPGFADEPPIRAVLAEAVITPDTLAQTLPAALQAHDLLVRYSRHPAHPAVHPHPHTP